MQAKITYQHNFINCDRLDLIDRVQQAIKPGRFKHVLRVEATALELAEIYGLEPADRERVSIASLMHDYAKQMDPETMLALASDYRSDIDLSLEGPAIWHGYAAANLARRDFSCFDEQILAAIAAHTTGDYEMSLVTVMVYLADYTEPGRDYKQANKVRRLVMENLDRAVRYKMSRSLTHLIKNGKRVFPESLNIYNYWTDKEFTWR